MREQSVKPKPLPFWAGVLLVLGIAAALMLATALANVIAALMGNSNVSLIVIVAAVVGAVLLLRKRALAYHYTINESTLYIERMYGQRTKVLESVKISDIAAIGSEMEMRERYPEATGRLDATLKACEIDRVGVVFRRDGGLRVVIIQPEEAFLAALWDEDARRASAEAKWGPIGHAEGRAGIPKG